MWGGAGRGRGARALRLGTALGSALGATARGPEDEEEGAAVAAAAAGGAAQDFGAQSFPTTRTAGSTTTTTPTTTSATCSGTTRRALGGCPGCAGARCGRFGSTSTHAAASPGTRRRPCQTPRPHDSITAHLRPSVQGTGWILVDKTVIKTGPVN